jgi:RNA polymerase sigma-70 factor (ECF subfamily)
MTQEQEVIRHILEGDIESFRFLLERYERAVVRMIMNITNDRGSSEDITQDVFFTAYRKLASYDPARGDFSTWLFTIARNKSINALRKRRAVSMSELPEQADEHNPSDRLTQKELFAGLDRVLRTLPLTHQRAFVMAEFERLSYEQIAQIEGVRLGTVKSRINRAKTRLRAALEDFKGDGL